MPDPIKDPVQQQPAGQEPAQSDADPGWMASIPEDQRKEAREWGLRQADYTKKTQTLADERRQFETSSKELQAYKEAADKHGHPDEWAKFWGGVQPYWETFTKYTQQQKTGQSQPQGGSVDDPWKDWDLTPANQQADRMAKHLEAKIRSNIEAEYMPQIQQAFKSRDEYNQNYLTLMRKAFEMKNTNPELDLDQLFQTAVDMQSGKINPLEVAQKYSTPAPDLDKMFNERLEQQKVQWEEEWKSKQQATTPVPGIPLSAFSPRPDAPKTAEEAKQRVREAVAEKYGREIL